MENGAVLSRNDKESDDYIKNCASQPQHNNFYINFYKNTIEY